MVEEGEADMEGTNRTFREKPDEIVEVTWYLDTEIARIFGVALFKKHFISLCFMQGLFRHFHASV